MSAACEFYLDACGNPEDIEELVCRLADPDNIPHFLVDFDGFLAGDEVSVEDEDHDYMEDGDRWVRIRGWCKSSIKVGLLGEATDYDESVHTSIKKTSDELDLPIEVYAETYPHCAEHYLCQPGEEPSYETRDRWEDFGDPEEGPDWEI